MIEFKFTIHRARVVYEQRDVEIEADNIMEALQRANDAPDPEHGWEATRNEVTERSVVFAEVTARRLESVLRLKDHTPA